MEFLLELLADIVSEVLLALIDLGIAKKSAKKLRKDIKRIGTNREKRKNIKRKNKNIRWKNKNIRPRNKNRENGKVKWIGKNN